MVYHHQPAKLAAFEAHYRTGPGDLSLLGVPDEATETIRFNLAIPGGLSFLVHDDFNRPVIGLDRFRPADRPPVLLSFASYHVMIGLGMLFVVVTLLAALLYWRRRLFETRSLLWVLVFAVAGPLVANELGWMAAEVGRQPWIVHPPVAWTEGGDLVVGPDGVVSYDESLGLRTADQSVRRSKPPRSRRQLWPSASSVGLLAVWLFLLDKKIRHGPEPLVMPDASGREGLVAAAARLRDRSDSLTGSAES
jgi:cytochrome d ubiquinol oxidase subunit I